MVLFVQVKTMKFIQKIFSVGNDLDSKGKKKFIRIFGIKITFKNYFRKYKFIGTNNHLYYKDKNSSLERRKATDWMDISLKGNNNIIILDKMYLFQKHFMEIDLEGDNNYIEIGKTNNINASIIIRGNNCVFKLKKTNFGIKLKSNMDDNSCIEIGENCSMGEVSIYAYQKNATIIIGDDCMFSTGILVQCHDGHKILDNSTGVLLNSEKNTLQIGNHVWIGRRSNILKKAVIPDNCIVGTGSVVTRKFTDENIAIAGNPAKIVRKNINWDRDGNF